MKVNGELLPPELNWTEIWNKIVEDLLENLLRDEKLAESEHENLLRDEKLAESEQENLLRDEKLAESELENLLRDEKLAESELENLLRDDKLAEFELENATPSLWLQLPDDIWRQILLRLSTIDKLRSADKVCSIWRRLLKEPQMWTVIDLRDQKCIPLRAMNTLFHVAVERSQGQCIDFCYAFCGSNDIVYLVERSSLLSRLWLRGWTSMGWGVPIYSGLLKMAKNLTMLEELSLQECGITPACIEALGEHCPKLSSFGLTRFTEVSFETEEEKNEDALAIATHLTSLRRLQLIGNSLTVKGLEAILDGCPNLNSLDLRRCFGIDTRGAIADRCAKQIDYFRHPTDSMEEFLFLV